MAKCFCGCGRTVRFGRKRASKWGAETDQILGILETCLAFDPVHDEAAALIVEGNEYRDFWLAFAHGADLTSPVHPALAYRERFFQWKERGAALWGSVLASPGGGLP